MDPILRLRVITIRKSGAMKTARCFHWQLMYIYVISPAVFLFEKKFIRSWLDAENKALYRRSRASRPSGADQCMSILSVILRTVYKLFSANNGYESNLVFMSSDSTTFKLEKINTFMTHCCNHYCQKNNFYTDKMRIYKKRITHLNGTFDSIVNVPP